MPDSTGLPDLPLPLALLRDTSPGTLYGLAGKNQLLEGLAGCRQAPVHGAEWREGKSELILTLHACTVSFKASGNRLVTGCSCRGCKPGSQCAHVITAWAFLKRIVSPESLFSVRFNEQHLAALSRLVGLAANPDVPATRHSSGATLLVERLQKARAARKAALAARLAPPPSEKKNFRLVLEIKHGKLFGAIRRGTEQVYGWSPLPPDLRSFVARHYFFEPTRRYFSEFAALKGGYQIVLSPGQDTDSVLAWQGEAPVKPGITFCLDGDTVNIHRCLADGSFLPDKSWIAGECLIDPGAKAVRPVDDPEPWKLWETVHEELVVMADLTGEPFRYSGTTLSAGIRLFNYATVRLAEALVRKLGKRIRFVVEGYPVEPPATDPIYLLDMEDRLDDEPILIRPRGEAFGLPFPFSVETFRLFHPAFRSVLLPPLRTKKRLTAMVQGGFSVLEAATGKARDVALRNALRGPDFIKRKTKAEAKQLISAFVRDCDKRMLLILAAGGAWRLVTDDRFAQARLMKLLYDLFGLDPFMDGDFPCSLELPRHTLLPLLGRLAVALRELGFGLRINDEPLATGSWNFTIDASRNEIDWFELKPEIRLNGQLLQAEDVRAALAEGILRKSDGCFLVGEEERRILELLLGGGGRAGKKKKRMEVVRIPRLQILDWLELRARGVTLRLPPEDERLLASLTHMGKIPEVPLPAGLNATLRHYQKEGYDWLAFLLEHRFGACLADDMGLGKTVQTIAFLAGIAEGLIPVPPDRAQHLVVVPPSLLFNWESEIARFYPGFRVVTYAGSKRSPDFAGADIILTSYGILLRDIHLLAAISFNVIVFDEAQVVKNLQAATTGAARRLNGRFKLVLTGTPMENHLGEYYAIMDLCVPGLLGSYDDFRRRIDVRGFGGIDTLVRRTRPFILRRTKQMIADELPPRVESDLYLDMIPKQRLLYQKTVEEVKGAVDEAFRNKASGQARMIALTAILRLRQICLSPALLTGGKGESPKLECLADQLIELRDEGHSALVFSQFTSYLDIVEEGLKHRKLPYLRLDGSTPVAHRKSLVNRFQKSDEPLVFLISLKAGGKGLNLTRATYVYHLDPWWNPAVENQASDRAHRIGQTQRVTVTRLLMRHTVEEKMMTLKERKLKLYKALLDDAAGAGGASLSKEDFDFLLGR